MATTKSRTTSNRKSSTAKRVSSARRTASRRAGDLVDTVKDRPYTSAAIATGAVAAIAAAAAGAYFFSRRDKSLAQTRDELGEKLSDYGERIKDGLTEARDKASAFFSKDNDHRSQSEIAEEAETLKDTGDMLDKKSKRKFKTGAVAY